MEKKEITIKKQNIKWIIVGITLIGIALLVMIPILMNIFIFNNNVFSKASNDGWASFLGGYLGGIITLIGVGITIVNVNKENLKAAKRNEDRWLDEKRSNVAPYLTYELESIKLEELPKECLSIPIGIPIDNITNHTNNLWKIKIMNDGLRAACDLSIKIYINRKETYYYNKVAKPLRNFDDNCTKIFNFILLNKNFISNENAQCDLLLAFFYKDILGTQYVQELPGFINIVENPNLPEGCQYFFNFNDPQPARIISDEISYSLPDWINYDEAIKKYVSEHFSEYEAASNKRVDEILSQTRTMPLDRFEYRLISLAKETFDVPHMEGGRGDMIGYKQISDEVWQSVYFEERAYNTSIYIIYFIILELNLMNSESKIIDLQIMDNTLSANKRQKKKFEKKLKKLATSL